LRRNAGGHLIDWFYKEGDKKTGPVSEEQIRELARQGRISPDTMVWNELLAKWTKYSDAIGAPVEPPEPKPHVARLYIDPYAGDEAAPKETPPITRQPEPAGDYSYESPIKTESYCNKCFRKFPTAEMTSTPIGPVCAACSDSSKRGFHETSAVEGTLFKVEFTGSGQEYFKIWIVNLLLTIVTLGIYSPWAKVRKNKYFYRNTRIAGSSFDYHGNPVSILKGRILAVLIVAALHFSQQLSYALYIVVIVLVAIILPWMIARAFAFKLYNTSWRGIRMRFHGSITEAYTIALLYGALTVVSLWLCFPLLYRQIRLYFMNNAAFGTTKAELDVPIGSVYSVFIKTGLISLVVAVVMTVIGALFFHFVETFSFQAGSRPSKTMIFFLALMAFAMFLFYRVIVQSFFRTRMANLMWNHSRLGVLGFESFQRARDLASIIASNALLTVITLGFYWPWAKIQLVKYYADTLVVHAPEGFSNFSADVGSGVAAAGDEVTEALDVDFSF
jgi:uncharacterized membrane protein YjgN (DUF898 family)